MQCCRVFCSPDHCIVLFQTDSWMNEKQKKLEVEANKGEISSLEDKIKKLQKHQAFQAELAANQPRITTIKEKGIVPINYFIPGKRNNHFLKTKRREIISLPSLISQLVVTVASKLSPL